MNLGQILCLFDDEAVVTRLLPDLGDEQWRGRATSAAAAQGTALGDYAGAAVDRFATGAKDEDWLSLMAALNRSADPGAICLRRMIDWAMESDVKDQNFCAKHERGVGETR